MRKNKGIDKIWRIVKKYKQYIDKDRTERKQISIEEYYQRFDIVKCGSFYEPLDREKLKEAYNKAWENRNYEIDKFWTRAAYFWGFIAIIFTGYIMVVSGNDLQICNHYGVVSTEHNNKDNTAIEFILLLLGSIVSWAWILVIRGSKRWQENWEAHIDYLEDFISGPLYKLVFYEKKRFFSVSKLSEMIAIVIFITFVLLLIYRICDITLIGYKNIAIAFIGIIGIIIFLSIGVTMINGYGVSNIKHNGEKGFMDRLERQNSINKPAKKRL